MTALSGGNTASYIYDANGNMTCRVEDSVIFNQVYSSENRLWKVQQLSQGLCPAANTLATQYVSATWIFTYDGGGSRVKQEYTDGQSTSTTAYFFGGLYEVAVETSAVTACDSQ